MQNDIFISVMICCYNSEKYLFECIDSIIKHSKRPFGYIEYFNADTGAADYHSRMFIKMLKIDY